MRHLLDTPLGAMARNQQELAESTMDLSKFKREIIDYHLVCKKGFVVNDQVTGELRRMDFKEIEPVFLMLLKLRPSAFVLDIRPSCESREEVLVTRSPDYFRTTFADKARFLADAWARYPDMVGFSYQIHDLRQDRSSSTVNPSVTFKIYRKDPKVTDVSVPVLIDVEYMKLR